MKRIALPFALSSGPKDRVSKGRRWMPVLRYAALCAALSTSGNLQAEPLKIRIGWSTTPAHVTPMLPEIPKSVYRHWGTSYVVEPVFMQGTGTMLPSLAAEEAELVGYSYQTHASAVITGKLDVRAVAGVLGSKAPFSDEAFWVKKASNINKIEDLKGKTLAVNSRGSGVDTAQRMMLRRHGLADGKDYQVVEVRFAAMMATLDADKVEAAFLVLPFSLMAEKDARLKRLFSTREAMGPTETAIWGAKANVIAKHRPVFVDFLEDNIRARTWLYDPNNHDEVVKIVAKLTKQPEEAFKGWLFTQRDTFRAKDAMIDVKLLQSNIDDLVKEGLLPSNIDVAKYTDLSMVEEAKKRVGM
jgi:sulfonate transport system substrate-binding protein